MTRSRGVALMHLLAALLLFGGVVAQAPHLVHHLFEGEHAHEQCALGASAERLIGLSADIVVLTVEQVSTPAARAARPTPPLSSPRWSIEPRGPPPTAS